MSGAQRTASVLGEVQAERVRQELKFGVQDHGAFKWMTILGEEYGETCRALLEGDVAQARKEALEVAAVAVAFVESVDRKHEQRADGVRRTTCTPEQEGAGSIPAMARPDTFAAIHEKGTDSIPPRPLVPAAARPLRITEGPVDAISDIRIDGKPAEIVGKIEVRPRELRTTQVCFSGRHVIGTCACEPKRGETVTFIGMDPPGPVRPLISHVHDWRYGVPEFSREGPKVPVRCYCKSVRIIPLEQAVDELISKPGEFILGLDRRKERRHVVAYTEGEELKVKVEEPITFDSGFARPFGGATS